jgi:hypothetical protein
MPAAQPPKGRKEKTGWTKKSGEFKLPAEAGRSRHPAKLYCRREGDERQEGEKKKKVG